MSKEHVKLLIFHLKVEQLHLHTYTYFSCRFWSWMQALLYSWLTDTKLWLNQGMTFSSKGFRHLLWGRVGALDLTIATLCFSVGLIWGGRKYTNPVQSCLLSNNCSDIRHSQRLEPRRSLVDLTAAKCVYMAAGGVLGAGAYYWLVSKALSRLNKAVFLGDFTIEGRAMLLW